MLRVLIVLMVMGGVARADAPSGYKCGAGKANPGVGCTCPAGFADKRNSENHAICEKGASPPAVPPCRKAGIAIKNHIAQDGDMKKIAGDKQPAFLKEVAALIERRCLRDKWKGELINCFTQKTEEKEIEACAKSHLTKEQNQAIEEEFDIVEKKFRKSETPAPAEPPKSEGGGRVVVKDASIQILDQVFFQSSRATIQPVSFPLLDNVAQVLKEHPEILLVRVEGHTDSQGDDKANLKLSQDRANAVVAYLVKRGIEAQRLDAKGFGETKPLATNEKEAGRAQNRRIEFVILKK